MKTFLSAIAVLILGMAVGLGASRAQYSNDTYFGFSKPFAGSFPNNKVTMPDESDEVVLIDRPKVEVVGSNIHDFGTMMKDETRQCQFQVRNVGTGTLTLKFDSKSCQCTDVSISKPKLPPDETTTIFLSWKPRKFGLHFSQNALFRTNDPTRRELQFTIKGRVQQLVRTFPHSIDFHNITKNDTPKSTVFVYGYRDNDLEITNVEVLNEEYKDFIELSVGELEPKEIDLEPGAKSGAVVHTQLKLGLPNGPMYTRVRISFNKQDIQPLDVVLSAKVESEIRVLGKNYLPDRELIYVHGIPGSKPKEINLWLLIKGQHHRTCQVELLESDPPVVLSASVGEPKRAEMNSRIPIKVVITPTDRLVNRMGTAQGELGMLVFKTTHPDIPKLKIPVAFSVEAKP